PIRSSANPLRGRDGVFACAAFCAIPLLTQWWFAHIARTAPPAPDRPSWTLDAAALPPGWRAEPVEPRPGERAGLQFSAWQGFRIQSPGNWGGQIIHLVWKPGASMPSFAFYHTPALCMPWIGWTEVGQPKKVLLPLRTGPVPCVAYRFTQDGADVVALQ